MTTNTTSYYGIVHGTTIELGAETGLPDGLPVRITVQPANEDTQRLPPGEGLRRAFGAWAEDAEELDAFLAEIRRSRQRPRREIEP
jgi:hypothetical protein